MTHNPTPLAPGSASKEELERIAEALLKGTIQPATTAQIQGINLEDYIHEPKNKLYIAKQISLFDENWYETHKELHKQQARMLTLREFADFLILLKNGNAEFRKIYDEIAGVRIPFRAERLDAKFEQINGIWYINYNHRIINGELKPQNSEPLEPCIMKDCYVDLSSFNKQGLPTKEGRDFYYWHLKNNTVAGFGAGSGRAGLGCFGDPRGSYPALGVRVVRATKI